MPEILEGSALDQQLHLFEQRASKLDAGAQPNDLSSVIHFGLALFQQIHRTETHAAGRANPLDAASVNRARDIANQYSNWYRAARRVRSVFKSTARGDLEPLAGDFENACRHARVPALHFDDLLQLERPA